MSESTTQLQQQTPDPYHGVGGRYVMVDGRRVPAQDVAPPATADVPQIKPVKKFKE